MSDERTLDRIEHMLAAIAGIERLTGGGTVIHYADDVDTAAQRRSTAISFPVHETARVHYGTCFSQVRVPGRGARLLSHLKLETLFQSDQTPLLK